MALARRKRPRRRNRPRLTRLESLESRRLLATLAVNTTADTVGGICSDNVASSLNCSIRDAIIAAEATPEADTIEIPPGDYLIDPNVGSFDLEQSFNTSFVGTGQTPLDAKIDGQGLSRVFDLFGSTPFSVTFENLTIQNGRANDGSGGGGIVASDSVDLSIDNVVIQNNIADRSVTTGFPSRGGGISTSGNLTISNSVIRDNVASDDGGGISFGNAGKTMDISDSTISGNTAGDVNNDYGYGGGVFATGSDASTVLNRVTLSGNAATASGGGIYVLRGAVSSTSSNFLSNEARGADSGGGGMYVLGGTSPFSVNGGRFESNSAAAGAGGFESVNVGGTIDGATFEMNQVTGAGDAFDEGGGAIAFVSTVVTPAAAPSVTISNVLVSQNTAPSAAGIASVGIDLTIRDSTITNNTATANTLLGAAGGIGATRVQGSSNDVTVTVERSSILSNSAAGNLGAGGIGALDIDLVLIDSVVDGNSAPSGRAGGIGVAGQGLGVVPTLTTNRTTVSNNVSGGDGGGIGVDGAGFSITNTTVSNNQSQIGNGGGILIVDAAANALVDYSTVASNTANLGDNIATNTDLDVRGTLFADGTGAAFGATFNSLGNNIDQSNTMGLAGPGDISGVDPLIGPLADNGGPVQTHALLSASPAIDAGGIDATPATDARGVTRPQDGDGNGSQIADIGAFEVAGAGPLSLVVDENSDIVDGDFSPGNLSLREAIERANANPGADTITFGGPFADAIPDTITLGGSELAISDDVTITGPGSSLLSIDANGQSRVISIQDGSALISLSSMTITGGFLASGNGAGIINGAQLSITDSVLTGNTANSLFAEGYGGAIANNGNLTLTNTTISGNSAQNDGGGIANFGPLVVNDSSIVGNTADSFGGGLANFGETVQLQNSDVSGNTAGNDGGGIFNSGGTLEITNSTIDGNTTSATGGGIYSDGASQLTNTTISSNTAQSGGAISIGGGELQVNSSTLSSNSALANGGGVFTDAGSIELVNSTVSGNSAAGGGGGIYANYNVANATDPFVTVIQSTIVGNRSDSDGDGSGDGGGLGRDPDTRDPFLFNTLVAGNLKGPSGVDLSNDIGGGPLNATSANNLIAHVGTSGGLVEGVNGNLVGDGQGGSLSLSDIANPDLADNGGSTLTHSLVPGSRAFDAGDNSFATTAGDDRVPGTGDNNEITLDNDQRGDGFPRILGNSVDIGAFEAEPLPISSAPDLDPTSDTGVSNTDNITFVTTPRISGTADPGATVEIFDRVLPTRRLTFDAATDFFPTWDPASETIVFVTSRAPAGASVTNLGEVQSDATGEALSLIGPNTPFGSGHSPSWIGSTGQVMFAHQTGLHEYASYNQRNAPTSARTRELIVDGGGGGGNIVVSRDGTTALWRFSTSGGSGNISIRTASVASLTGSQSASSHGTLLQSINVGTNGPQFFNDGHGFDISPDGSMYVIAEPQNLGAGNQSNNGFDLFLRSTADGSEIRRLTTSGENFGAFNGQPTFSPDGTKIAFVRARTDQGVDDIVEIDLDGTNLRLLTHTGSRVTERMPSYSDDGNRLAFATPATSEAISPLFNEVNNWNVYVIEGLNDVQPPGALLGTTVADANGNWSLGVGVLSEGDHVLTSRATLGGTVGPVSDPLHLTIDTTAPEFPTIPDLNDASDTGVSNEDNITQDNTPTFDGTSLAGSKVELFANGTPIGSTTAANALYDANDYLIVDQSAQGTGAIFAVDPMTGTQTVVSSGQEFVSPRDLAFDADGNLFVIDQGASAVIQVDPFTGNQTIVSQGGLLQNPVGIVVEEDGNLLVTDDVTQSGAVIRIDPATGNQSILANNIIGVSGIALNPVGTIFVAESEDGFLIAIDPTTGNQRTVSRDTNFSGEVGLTVAPTGLIFAADRSAPSGGGGGGPVQIGAGAVLRIDPFTGEPTEISGAGDFVDPFDVIVDGVGDLIVPDFTADTLFRIDPSGQNVISSGGTFDNPVSVAAAVLPVGDWSFTSGRLDSGDYDITALATDVAGNVSGQTVVKHLEFNIDGVLPSREADVEFATNSGNTESSIFAVSGGQLSQQTTGFDGNAVYGFPTAPNPNGPLDPTQGIVQEIRVDPGTIQGDAGASFQAFDGVTRYSASVTSTGVRITALGGDVNVPVDFSVPRTLRLESPGDSDDVRLYVDDVLAIETKGAPLNNLNGFLLGDSLSAAGNGADVQYDFYRVAQQVNATPLPITIDTPRLIVEDVFVEESASSVDIFVSIDSDIGTPFSVDYMTVNDSALDGEDYSDQFGTLNFNGFADDIQVITIPIIDDDIAENDEQFFISFDNVLPDTVTLDTSALAPVSIFDDDEVTLSIGSDSTVEDDGFLTLTVTMFGETDEPFTVDVSTFDIEAVDGEDYTGLFTQLTFDGFDGETQDFTVQLSPDAIVELDEDFGFTIDNIDAGTRDIKFDNFADFISFNSIGQFTPAGGGNFNDVSLFTPAVDKTIAYVGEDAGFTILDVSDPANVVELGTFPTNDPVVDVETIDVSFFADIVFAAAGSDGLLILDIADPANIMSIGGFNQAGQRTLSLDRLGGTVYIGEANGQNQGLLRIIDASDPMDITLLSETELAAGEEVLDLVTDGATAFLATNEGGLQIFDVSNPMSPAPLGTLPTREAISITANGNRVFLGTPTGLSVVDVSDLNNPTEVGFFTTNSPVTSVDENDGSGIVSISDGSGQFRVVNTEFAPTVFEIGSINLGGNLGGFDSEGLFSYISNGAGGLQIVKGDLGAIGTGTIINDDTATLSISDAAADEDSGSIVFTVTLSAAVDVPVNVDFSTEELPNEAVDGTDFTGDADTLTFNVGPAGQTETITISITPDAEFEDDEIFALDLFGVDADGRDVTIAAPTRVFGTIINDDFPPIILMDDAFQILEDSTPPPFDVLGNDEPIGGLTIIDITQGNLGGVTITPGGGSVTYSPFQHAFGVDTFTYTVIDGFGQTDTAEVTVTIDPVNDPPVAVDDFVDAPDRNPFTILVSDLLSNDNGGPGENDNFVIDDVDTISAAGGTVDFAPGGDILYTPPAGFTGGTDTFQYTLIDDGDPPEISQPATVTITFAATLRGHIFCDRNNNGVEDGNEAVVGTLVFLDANGNRRLDAGEASTTTDDEGDYFFSNVVDPTLTVVAEIPNGCVSVPTNPGISRSQVDLNMLARSLVAVDFDGDEDLDIITVGDLVNDQATYLRNNGGVFDLARNQALGDRPQSIDAWSENGSQLIAAAGIGTPEDGGSVYILDDDGPPLQLEAGNGPVDLSIDDFDRNGIPDIIVAALRSSDVQLILNGDPAIPIGSARLVRAVESGDVNDDGNPDIVLGGFSYPDDESSELAVRLGDGLGGFGDSLFTNPIRELVDLGVGPLNEFDDNGDVGNVVWSLSETGTLSLYDVIGGSLQLINSIDVTPGATSFDTGDFNRDGRTDVAIANLGKQLIELYVGDGDGDFKLVTTIDKVSAPSDIIVADFNDDGADDLAVTNIFSDLNLGDSEEDPDYELPSTVTVLLVDVAEEQVVISGGVVGDVDFAFQNADPQFIFDVTGEGEVTALDALRVINALPGSRTMAEGEQVGRAATDVNGDGRTSAVDALMIINYMSRQEDSGLGVAIDLLADEDDEEERYAAVDVVFGELV